MLAVHMQSTGQRAYRESNEGLAHTDGFRAVKELYRLGGIIGECLAGETSANQEACLQTNGGGQDRA